MSGTGWSEKEPDRHSLRRLSILRQAEGVSESVAATAPSQATVLAYEPVDAWITGMGVVEFQMYGN
jgi:hypothetical protein